jgi:LytS/YehU family sensor histidine kinase
VTVQEELMFIRHYFHLLKTRFGNGIDLFVDVQQGYFPYSLPPLTLQLLVENAVKHNAILEEKPLQIQIHNKLDELVVENGIQLKSTPVISGKLGLNNILQKYKLLGGKEVRVEKSNDTFRVIIPLFKETQYETVNSRR